MFASLSGIVRKLRRIAAGPESRFWWDHTSRAVMHTSNVSLEIRAY